MCVSTIKQKPPDRNDLKLGTLVVLDSLSKPNDFGFRRSMAQGHHFELLAPLSYQWNGCRYKVQILCTNALRAFIARGSKIMPERGRCHGI